MVCRIGGFYLGLTSNGGYMAFLCRGMRWDVTTCFLLLHLNERLSSLFSQSATL